MDSQKGIRILHVVDSGGLYGAEMMLLSLMDEQLRLGDSPLLCSIGNVGESKKAIEREAELRGHRVVDVRMARGLNFRGARTILGLARRYGVDVVHSHGYKSDILLGMLTKRIRRFPMVSTLHGWTSSTRLSRMRFYEWLDCISLNGIDAVITVNKALQHTTRFRWCLNRNVRCIPNGIPILSDECDPLSMDDPINSFCNGHFVVGALGRLSSEKGYDTLIHSFHGLRNKGVEARLVIIGEGGRRSALEDLVTQLGLGDSVLLPGFRENAKRYLPLFGCFVISSLTEGLPISLLEAMAAGTPVISTNVGGIAEALDYGKAGILLDVGDLDGLTEAMLSVLSNPDISAQMASIAQKITKSEYSSETMALSYRETYSELLTAAYVQD